MYGGVCARTMGFHEGAKEILAPSDNHRAGTAWKFDCPDSGLSGCALRLYLVLKNPARARATRGINYRINL